MTIQRFTTMPEIRTIGEDECEVILSTPQRARDGHVLDPMGCNLGTYQANPIVLWQHDPSQPIGRCEDLKSTPAGVTGRVRFAPVGISPVADMVRGMVKAGILAAVSVGFNPTDGKPLDPRNPRKGQRFTKWDLMELSFVSVPADTGAIVTARSIDGAEREQRRRALAMLRLGEPAVIDAATIEHRQRLLDVLALS